MNYNLFYGLALAICITPLLFGVAVNDKVAVTYQGERMPGIVKEIKQAGKTPSARVAITMTQEYPLDQLQVVK